MATEVFRLRDGDVGRPVTDIAARFTNADMVSEIKEVLRTLQRKEIAVRRVDDDVHYMMRILPYRTANNTIDGVVMTLADITTSKQLETSLREQKAEAQAARDYAENIIATVREPLVVLDGQLRVVSASRSFYATFRVTREAIEGRLLYEIGRRQWDIPELRKLLEEILPGNTPLQDFRMEHDFADVGRKTLVLNARRMAGQDRQPRLILLAMEDVTQQPARTNEPKGSP